MTLSIGLVDSAVEWRQVEEVEGVVVVVAKLKENVVVGRINNRKLLKLKLLGQETCMIFGKQINQPKSIIDCRSSKRSKVGWL